MVFACQLTERLAFALTINAIVYHHLTINYGLLKRFVVHTRATRVENSDTPKLLPPEVFNMPYGRVECSECGAILEKFYVAAEAVDGEFECTEDNGIEPGENGGYCGNTITYKSPAGKHLREDWMEGGSPE